MSLMSGRRIAITGMGSCCAAGADVVQILDSLKRRKVSCQQITDYLFHTELTYPVFVLNQEVLSPESLNFLGLTVDHAFPQPLNRTLLLALEATAAACKAAGIKLSSLQKKRVGIVLGTTVGCTFNDENYYIRWREGQRPDPAPVFRYLSSNLATTLQAVLDVQGPAVVVTNACASGTDAIGIGCGWLKQGLCDIVIAGGADELSRIAYHGFASLMLLSESSCTPFDQNRSGLNLGEGSGVLILEQQVEAEDRGAQIQGWIRGYGVASDCYHPTAPHPEGKGLQRALAQALHEAGISVDDISFINAHGTGTAANDSAETAALAAMEFTDCPVVSTKGITGHMLGAAGAVEAILTLHVLREQQTNGTVSCSRVDPKLAYPVLMEKEQALLQGRLGISQSLAFGGTNSALVLEGNTA